MTAKCVPDCSGTRLKCVSPQSHCGRAQSCRSNVSPMAWGHVGTRHRANVSPPPPYVVGVGGRCRARSAGGVHGHVPPQSDLGHRRLAARPLTSVLRMSAPVIDDQGRTR
jgi:hypothetical protein